MSSYNAVQKEQKTPLAELSWSDTDETILKSLDLYDDFKFWEHFFENDILTYGAITGDYGVACSDGERSVGEVVRSFDFSMDPFPHTTILAQAQTILTQTHYEAHNFSSAADLF